MPLKQYDVTIGIPLYRAAGYIGNTMESALAQTYGDIEFLVVDDCGGDGSVEIVERLREEHQRGSHIRILKNTSHQGPGPSRNRLIDEAQGRYLYFLDSDDLIEPNTIELLMDKMKRHHPEVVYASYQIVDKVHNAPNQLYQKPYRHFTQLNELALFAFKHKEVFHISVCNCLIDMQFLRGTGIRFIDTMFWEDMAFTYDFVTRVSQAVLLPNITYHYLRRPGSLSHYQDREQLQKSEIMKNVSTIDYLKKMCRKLKGKTYLPYLCYNLEMNSFYIACHVLKHSHRIVPAVSHQELIQFMHFPLPLADVLRLRKKYAANLALWTIAHLPAPVFVAVVKMVGKLKKVI